MGKAGAAGRHIHRRHQLAQKFIRDDKAFGLAMIPLFCTWNIHRCNVDGCREKPTTIVSDDDLELAFGLCERHFQQTKPLAGVEFELVFDEFNAFEGAC